MKDERDEGTAGADDIPDAIVPRLSVTARDVFIHRFPPRASLRRREWKWRGGAFHLTFRNDSGHSSVTKRLAEYLQNLRNPFWSFHNCAKPFQCPFKTLNNQRTGSCSSLRRCPEFD